VGLTNAINTKQNPVPFLGEKFNEWFKKSKKPRPRFTSFFMGMTK
jgi:hypothetical protein